ncbi:DUF4331 domain-containing protein [Nocardioides donggukensis]|uniref:DUF4331 domain-containing protein n=1 Tax=Nocardioides donggukensis TaxID=2774019 RepID=A0A927K4N6_9ACTN|nr:DUF4331 domain-containing protein [Nocardioides donggukensis]MBD8870169.1 DUF4331 domain-containing protein [Nocardioides donggukensis]
MNSITPPSPRWAPSRRGVVAITAAGGMLASVGLAGLGPVGASASSHREAPLIAGAPQYDTTDVYAFRSPDRKNAVTLVANWLPFSEPAGGPNFYSFATDARYNVKIDNDGDAKPEITYRWTFKDHYRSGDTFLYANGEVDSLRDENLNYYQTYRLVRLKDKGNRIKKKVLVKSRRVAPSNVGEATMPNYEALRDEATTEVQVRGKTLRSFAGQAEDPFFLDLRVFDLLYGGDFSESGDDTLAGFNVNSVALQVPRRQLAKKKKVQRNPIVGIWSTTDRRGVDGSYRQVSRLGMPLVNEVVIPVKDKDKFNASSPAGDGQFLDYVTKPELPKLIEAVYGIEAPEEPRNDLVQVFLTGVEGLNQPRNVTPSEQLRLNMTTPITSDAEKSRLGVIGGDNQGFPNGRRLDDDVIDIALQVVEGELVGNENDLSDGVDQNDVDFSGTFPYLALPASGSDPNPHPGGGPVAKQSGSSEQSMTEQVAPASALAIGLLAMGAGAAGMVRRRRATS